MPTKVLQLMSAGNHPVAVLKELEEPLRGQLGLATSVSKLSLQTPDYAFNKDRGQYHSNAIIRRLSGTLEKGSHFALAVVDVDLFVPDAPFVFGDADRESRIALISLARLKAPGDPDVTRRRSQGEAVHQAGHLVGLSYCEDPRCVMFLAAELPDVDRRGLALCNLCKNELVKLQR